MRKAKRADTAGKRRPRQVKMDVPKIGHNSAHLGDADRRKLRGYVAELERIGGEVDELKAEAAAIITAAGEANFDVRTIRTLVRERRLDKGVREAREAILESYRLALGPLAGTPLGRAAVTRERKRQAEEEHAGQDPAAEPTVEPTAA
jgi:uncharacterized protein (UPF0335 family)